MKTILTWRREWDSNPHVNRKQKTYPDAVGKLSPSKSLIGKQLISEITLLLCGLFAYSQCMVAQLPDAPSATQAKVADAKFWAAVAVTAGLTAFDAQASQAAYARNPACEETGTPWLYGRRPGPAREWSTMAGEVVIAAVVSYQLKKHRFHRFWVAPLAYSAIIHTYGGIHSASHC